MLLLDLEAAKEVILEMASSAQAARIYTYSFRPTHWVEELLHKLPASDIYISCAEDQNLLYQLPEPLRRHRYHRLERSHAKIFAFKNKGNNYSAVVGSLNAVETGWAEFCHRVNREDAERLWNQADYLTHYPHDLSPPKQGDGSIEFNAEGEGYTRKLPPTRRILRERVIAALASRWVESSELEFLRSMRDNWLPNLNKDLFPLQIARMERNFRHCGV